MTKRSLILSLSLLYALSTAATEIQLLAIHDPQEDLVLYYHVELEHLLRTPSWKIGAAYPLDQDKLLSILHARYPELTDEAISSIELKKVTSIITGGFSGFENKWFYCVLWNNNRKLERTIVLLDGSIVEPQKDPYKKTSAESLFPIQNHLYIGDDPSEIKEMKRRADEQLRLIAPGLVDPETGQGY